jgi:hypothetical protein
MPTVYSCEFGRHTTANPLNLFGTKATAHHGKQSAVPLQVKQWDRLAMIAATALVHGLTVVTRNTKDFKPVGVELLNPFAQ